MSVKYLLSFLLFFFMLQTYCTTKTESNNTSANNSDIKEIENKIKIQILGSGGPEFSERASSSYIVWVDDKAKALIDLGAGSFLRFTESGAKIEDLDFIGLTHLHIDHSADLPAFMKAGYFSERTKALPIIGTTAQGDFPNINDFVIRLFGENGAYAYMQDILNEESESFQIKPILLEQELTETVINEFKITTIGVHHGIIPAIAFAIEIDGKKIVFAGDTNAQSDHIVNLAKDADYLIVHHAIPEHAGKFAQKLHITPHRIGEVAKQANVKTLVLSHRMKRTYNLEEESLTIIQKNFKGNIIWAEDLMILNFSE